MAAVDLTNENQWATDPLEFANAGSIGAPVYGDTSNAQPVTKGFDIAGEYRNLLGRDPDAQELASETENIGKYGLAQLQSNLLERARGRGGVAQQGPQLAPNQFDDAYSQQLESIAKAQMGQVRSNPDLDALLGFLRTQFTDLSQNPGYNPQEMALLNTQAFEPIEANRQASKQRALERTAARGFAPTSGLNELDLRDIDMNADRSRTVAGRDLAIAGLNRRDQDLSQALDIGRQLGLSIPQGQRQEELGLANLLYQMPRQSLMDALSVINGSPTSGDAFNQALQLLQTNTANQQLNDQRNSQFWQSLGEWLPALLGGRR